MKNTKQYLVAIKANTNKGISEGNNYLTIDRPLDMEAIEEIKKNYCAALAEKGVHCTSDQCVVYAIIPLV
jgi:hypothetical protein